MKKPLVSVIMPIYNAKKYLKKCLESILGQNYQDLEIILVDDGSTDGSAKIADDFASIDKRVITIHQKNGGQSRARNVGIEKANGEYISFVDDDDEIKPDFIEKLINFSQNNTLAVAGMRYRKLYNNTIDDVYISQIQPQRKGESIEEYVLRLMILDGRMYSSVNKLYRTSIIKKNNLRFEEGVNFAEDTHFVLKYIKAAKCKITSINEPLYIYNSGTANSTIKKSGAIWENWQKSYQFLQKWAGEKPSLIARLRLKIILARWRVSYWKTKKRAKI